MAGQVTPPVRVEVLGPLRLLVDGAVVDVRGPKRRAVLALLALAEGRTVSVDSLLDALWPDEVPESGRQALHSHVFRLRAHLGAAAARLETQQDGYRLNVDGELDLTQARAALASARAASSARDRAGAHAVLRQAHALWRGPVLADLTDVAPIAAAVEGCAQLLREVTDALIASAVAAGQADGVLGLATASVAADPLREPAVLLQMRALAATGRAPEALSTGREYRRRLADETGLDPSPALGELERDIAGGAAGPAPAGSDVPVRPTTRLIGRDGEVAALHRLLAGERLATVVGPGGVGKTRVALEVARRSTAATVLLLAPVSDATAIPHALASALRLDVVQGDVLAACVAVLGDEPRLLVVDNCEHLVDAARDTIGVLLAGCPRLTVLATSREPIGLAAEYVYRLTPLTLPPLRETAADASPAEVEALEQVPSVAVFLDRAARVRRDSSPVDLRLVAGIVRRLDGMPLAIELAAGRLSTFSLDDLHERLDRALDLLGGGRPSADARHRTLRATIEWSYQLLTEDEQRLFRYLSVFVDGVALDAAERLAADVGLASDPGSVLARLVDASMIEAHFDDGTRYRMLETVRAFGSDLLVASGEVDAAGACLLTWARRLATDIRRDMPTDREPVADAVLRREMANLRSAWLLARRSGDLDAAATLVVALFEAVAYRDLVEIRSWAEELADDPAVDASPVAAAVLGVAAEASYHRGDYGRAERLARAGLERAGDDASRWNCLLPLAAATLARGAYDEVVEHALAASVALAEHPRESFGLAALATAYAGDLERARTLNERGIAVAASPSMRSWADYVAAEIESAAGNGEVAEQLYLRAIDLARSSGATFLAGVAKVGLVSLRAAAGRVPDALLGYREVIDYFARTGNWTHQWVTLRNLADLLHRLGDDESASVLETAAEQAPDAPADDPARRTRPPADGATAPAPSRDVVLHVARRAIERHLTSAALAQEAAASSPPR